jgi:hypothetical protein
MRAIGPAMDENEPMVALDPLDQALPWLVLLPPEEQIQCVQDLLGALAADSRTGERHRFQLSSAAWKSTAIAWIGPAGADLNRVDRSGICGSARAEAR